MFENCICGPTGYAAALMVINQFAREKPGSAHLSHYLPAGPRPAGTTRTAVPSSSWPESSGSLWFLNAVFQDLKERILQRSLRFGNHPA